MKNKLIKTTILCITLAVVGLMFAGCANTSTTGSSQGPYYVALNSFQNDQNATLNTQEHLSTILFGENGKLTVTSADVYNNNTGTGVPYQRESDTYDTEITFMYNDDSYAIQPEVDQDTKEIKWLNILKNGAKTQQMNWATKVN